MLGHLKREDYILNSSPWSRKIDTPLLHIQRPYEYQPLVQASVCLPLPVGGSDYFFTHHTTKHFPSSLASYWRRGWGLASNPDLDTVSTFKEHSRADIMNRDWSLEVNLHPYPAGGRPLGEIPLLEPSPFREFGFKAGRKCKTRRVGDAYTPGWVGGWDQHAGFTNASCNHQAAVHTCKAVVTPSLL